VFLYRYRFKRSKDLEEFEDEEKQRKPTGHGPDQAELARWGAQERCTFSLKFARSGEIARSGAQREQESRANFSRSGEVARSGAKRELEIRANFARSGANRVKK
jgi:hypothetical protein